MDELLFDDSESSLYDSLDNQKRIALFKVFCRRLWQRWRIYDIGASMTDEDSLRELLGKKNPQREDVIEMLQSKFLAIPERDSFGYRGIIWQIILHVYDKHRQTSSAEELEQVSEKLAIFPRDPFMMKEIDDACVSIQYIAGDFVRSGMETVLIWLLKTKSVPYTSGMAQALAPFFLMQLPLHTIYDCFYRYCALYLPHLVSGTFSLHEDDLPIELEQRQHLTEHLLFYHDPALAQFLVQWTPDWIQRIVPIDYFCCNLYRRLPAASFLYLLDQYLITGDVEFGLFVVIALVMLHRDEIISQQSTDGVKSFLQTLWNLERADHAALTVMFATSLRRKTPTSYTHLWRMVPHSAFTRASTVTSDNATVDMSKWIKQESKTLTGRFYWHHPTTKVTQWEHPMARHEAPPPLLCLSTSIAEIVTVNLAPGVHSNLRYFIVDCRGTRSSQDIKSGAIPSAYPLDPSVFDNPELMDTALETLRPLRSQVHIVLVGHGSALAQATTDELAAHIREGVREDVAVLNRAALFFQKNGFRFVSCLDGGFSSWHEFMRESSFTSVHELISHEESECRYCRIHRGADPDVARLSRPKRRSSLTSLKMPTISMPQSLSRFTSNGSKERLSIASNSSTGSKRDSIKGRLSFSGWPTFSRGKSNIDDNATSSTECFDGEEDLSGEPMEPRASYSDDDEEIEITLPTLSA